MSSNTYAVFAIIAMIAAVIVEKNLIDTRADTFILIAFGGVAIGAVHGLMKCSAEKSHQEREYLGQSKKLLEDE